jgi:D-3-phosphoglycerate dehydrogenase
VNGRIAVTPRSLSAGGHPALRPLEDAGFEIVFPSPGRQPTLEEQLAVLPGCVGYLAGVEPVPGDLLRQCRSLRVISRNGVGADAIDIAAARELGIAVRIAAGTNAVGVAELAIGLMLALVRSVPASDAGLKAGQWSRRQGVELRGRQLGVIGCGQIGRRVVEMALGIGMVVRAFDAVEDPSFAPVGDFAWAGFDAVLSTSDVLSLHCPPGARPLIDAEAIARMRPGAYLVNTARAALVDAAAVLAALESKALAGFATDVFDPEPPVVDELLARADVIATPHIGAFTAESVERATVAAVRNVLDALEQHPPTV